LAIDELLSKPAHAFRTRVKIDQAVKAAKCFSAIAQ
jgi:hypothetical protein